MVREGSCGGLGCRVGSVYLHLHVNTVTGLKPMAQVDCNEFNKKMYRHGPSVSTGFCGLHHVSHLKMQAIYFEGLVFREFEDSDATSFASAARESVETVGRWMPWCSATFSDQDALDWFQACRTSLALGSAFEFGIFSESTAEFIGGVGLNSINRQHLFCNLGYWVRQTHQRRGVASRSVRALVPHAFQAHGLRRVEIVVAEGNAPSKAVALKAGAQLECVARNRLHIHGVSVPATVFSLVP
jgi:RimJ/RimL family protein N-acetyltransferase